MRRLGGAAQPAPEVDFPARVGRGLVDVERLRPERAELDLVSPRRAVRAEVRQERAARRPVLGPEFVDDRPGGPHVTVRLERGVHELPQDGIREQLDPAEPSGGVRAEAGARGVVRERHPCRIRAGWQQRIAARAQRVEERPERVLGWGGRPPTVGQAEGGPVIARPHGAAGDEGGGGGGETGG